MQVNWRKLTRCSTGPLLKIWSAWPLNPAPMHGEIQTARGTSCGLSRHCSPSSWTLKYNIHYLRFTKYLCKKYMPNLWVWQSGDSEDGAKMWEDFSEKSSLPLSCKSWCDCLNPNNVENFQAMKILGAHTKITSVHGWSSNSIMCSLCEFGIL